MPPQARFYSHPRGTVFATIPEGVNLAFVDGLLALFSTPAMKDRDLANRVMGFFITGFVAVGVDSRFNAYARARDVLSLGDIYFGDGQSFRDLDPLARRIFDSTYDPTLSNIGGWMGNDETDRVVDLTSGDVSYATGRFIQDSPVLLPSGFTLAELTSSFSLGGSSGGALEPTADVQELSPLELVNENLLVVPLPPANNRDNTSPSNKHDNTSPGEHDSIIASPPHKTQDARLQVVPTACFPSRPTIFSMINIRKYQNPLSLNWNAIAIAIGLTVIIGFNKSNIDGLRRPAVAVKKSGPEKNESRTVCDLPQLLEGVVEEKPSLFAHVGEHSAPIVDCSRPVFVTGDFNQSSPSHINLTIQSPDNGFNISSSYGAFSGRGKGDNKLPIALFVGLLVAMGLVYLGLTLMKSIGNLFQTRLLPIFESSIEVSICQELGNAVPEKLFCDDLVPVNAEAELPTRLAPPLGCVILTPSGPCSIDPRPNRQITQEEDKSKFGLPVEALAYPRTPLAGLASCFAGSRPESPHKTPRKVAFADENDVFILPHVNLTRDRNLRRRLSRRLTAKAASDDGNNTNVPVTLTKRR